MPKSVRPRRRTIRVVSNFASVKVGHRVFAFVAPALDPVCGNCDGAEEVHRRNDLGRLVRVACPVCQLFAAPLAVAR
jgi:hypothetical protein